MSAADCTADLDHPCDGGVDGDPCPSCQANEDEWEALYRATPESVRRLDRMTPEDLHAEMADAGRGHLVRP